MTVILNDVPEGWYIGRIVLLPAGILVDSVRARTACRVEKLRHSRHVARASAALQHFTISNTSQTATLHELQHFTNCSTSQTVTLHKL